MAKAMGFITKYWHMIVFVLTIVFVGGSLYANIIRLETSKAESYIVVSQGEKIAELCEKKLDKPIFESHEKRDDDRFGLMFTELQKRLDRIENKIDSK